MKHRLLMVVNPKAGRAKIKKYVNELRNNFEKSECKIDLRHTTITNSAKDIIEKYKKDFDILIVCGGDGTLNQAVQALHDINKDVQIGFIPAGTTNDFARSLGVTFNKFELSNSINRCITERVDFGKFNDRVFNYVASTGMFSKTSYNTSTRAKNIFGRFAYIVSGIGEVFTCKPSRIIIRSKKINLDDEFIYCSISNSKYIGGFNIFKKQHVDLSDGVFEALFIKKPNNIFNIAKLIIKIINGNFNDKYVKYFKTSELSIESQNDMEWSIDGEYSGKLNKVHIKNVKKSMEYIIPCGEKVK